MKSIKIISAVTALLLALSLTACDETPQSGSSGSSGNISAGADSGTQGTPGNDPVSTDSLSNYDKNDTYDYDSAVKITFDGASAAIDGSGATAEGGKVTITAEGSYVVSGTATNGHIIVNVSKDEKVQLILNGADITSTDYAAIHIMSADKVKITLAEGTVNKLTDAAAYSGFINENEPTGCVFSKDDLTINGSGTLTVTGNYNNGIASKNDIRIVSGTVNVIAKNHGIKGKDSVFITGGNVNVNASNDGIKADNELEKGYITITGGVIDVKAGDDALQAFSSITATGGKITATAEGKITHCDYTVDIATGVLTVVNQ